MYLNRSVFVKQSNSNEYPQSDNAHNFMDTLLIWSSGRLMSLRPEEAGTCQFFFFFNINNINLKNQKCFFFFLNSLQDLLTK